MSKIGSISPCNMCALYNDQNKIIGQCLDTPNAFAYACILNNNVVKGVAHYQYFGEELRFVNCDDIQNRIKVFANQIFDTDEIKQKFFIKFYD